MQDFFTNAYVPGMFALCILVLVVALVVILSGTA